MDLDQVTLAQMRYAVAVEGAQSFRLAASQCHVSQSGLSMQVRKLEELLGVVLFDRSKKPVIVTPEGETALAQMRAVLRETERLGQIVAEEDEPSGRYRLGVIPTLSPTVLPLFLADFVDLHPRVELVVEELKTEEIIARLQADTLDAGLAATPLDVPGLAEEPLGDELMYAYLPRARSAAARGRRLADGPPRARALGDARGALLPEPGPRLLQRRSAARAAPDPLRERQLPDPHPPRRRRPRRDRPPPALVVAGLSDATRRAQVRPLVAPTPVREIGLVTARADLRRRVSDALVAIARRRLSRGARPAPPRGRCHARPDRGPTRRPAAHDARRPARPGTPPAPAPITSIRYGSSRRRRRCCTVDARTPRRGITC
ncbi:MAG: LysR family transcriptional regulator [Deltaproteobacteria bacterium]|nr:LysR family transcriptional regulator [Deltaproteobacteria bacterium]